MTNELQKGKTFTDKNKNNNNNNLVWHSYDFLLSCITAEENFNFKTTSVFKLYNVCFTVE